MSPISLQAKPSLSTFGDAIDQALAEEMQHDSRVLIFGEGTATKRRALLDAFGPRRVRNTPLAEAAMAGTAAGAAAMGLRPVVDMLYTPFLMPAMDAIANSAGKLRYLSGGQFAFPMVLMAQTGAGWTVGGQHHHNLEALFVHLPGLKVLMPSTPADAKGLLKAAIRDDNPVLFFTDMTQQHETGELPAGDQWVPIGRAAVRRQGSDVTLVSYSKAVAECLQAAQVLGDIGVDAEVVDLRSLKPLDADTVLRSVLKTGRLVVVHEAAAPCGVGAEVAAIVAEHAFAALKAPICRLTGVDAPAPSSWVLEQAAIPRAAAIVAAVRQQLSVANQARAGRVLSVEA